MNAQAFVYWYISIFLIGFGVFFMIRNRKMTLSSSYFRGALKDPVVGPRLRTVLSRREELEAIPAWQMLVVGASFVFFGVLTLAHVVSPAMADALCCADSALTLAMIFAAVRNNSDRRAASLTPRTLERVIPPFALAGAAVSSLIPLTLAGIPDLRVASIIASLSALAICFAASKTAGMAAILVGDDIDVEVFVDERIRRARACGSLGLAYAISPVFLAAASPVAADAPLFLAALGLASALIVPYLAWFLFVLRRRPSHIHGALV